MSRIELHGSSLNLACRFRTSGLSVGDRSGFSNLILPPREGSFSELFQREQMTLFSEHLTCYQALNRTPTPLQTPLTEVHAPRVSRGVPLDGVESVNPAWQQRRRRAGAPKKQVFWIHDCVVFHDLSFGFSIWAATLAYSLPPFEAGLGQLLVAGLKNPHHTRAIAMLCLGALASSAPSMNKSTVFRGCPRLLQQQNSSGP